MTVYQKTFIKCVTVLSVIALLSGLLLGIFNSITQISESEREKSTIKQIRKISNLDYKAIKVPLPKQIEYFFGAENNFYAISAIGKGGFGGDVQVLVIIERNLIKKVAIGANKETPGVSDKAINGEKFLSQFEGKDVTNIAKAFTEGSVDNASSATYSSEAIKDAIKIICDFYINYE